MSAKKWGIEGMEGQGVIHVRVEVARILAGYIGALLPDRDDPMRRYAADLVEDLYCAAPWTLERPEKAA